jgi:hypothetical protein
MNQLDTLVVDSLHVTQQFSASSYLTSFNGSEIQISNNLMVGQNIKCKTLECEDIKMSSTKIVSFMEDILKQTPVEQITAYILHLEELKTMAQKVALEKL